MRQIILSVLLISALCLPTAFAQSGPSDPKAQKTYADAQTELKKRDYSFAIEYFRKADKQDGGHCLICEKQAMTAAEDSGDYKTAIECGETLLAESTRPEEKVDAHYRTGLALYQRGVLEHKDNDFSEAEQEFKAALEIQPNDANLHFAEGLVLARLKQDDAARDQFQVFIKLTPQDSRGRQRAQRFANRPELARAAMAPAFSVTTLDGKQLSMDDLEGKVVLIDFWATWCGPCRQALPHLKAIAHNFSGQPLVVLSVSLDRDAKAWQDFVSKNEMNWPQYRDGGFEGNLAKLFAVHAIPSTFSIDSDGVLQDEHVGDASIEGKLKKLVARANERQSAQQKAQKE